MALALPDAGEKAAVVRAMFDRIAPRYDVLNRLIAFRLDQRWRRAVVRAATISAQDRVIDLACGTGDLSELAVRTGARVVGVPARPARLAPIAFVHAAAEVITALEGALVGKPGRLAPEAVATTPDTLGRRARTRHERQDAEGHRDPTKKGPGSFFKNCHGRNNLQRSAFEPNKKAVCRIY